MLFRSERLTTVSQWMVLGFLSLTITLSGCSHGGPPQFPPSTVSAEPVTVTTWMTSYVGSGSVEANNKVDMSVETGGTITGLFFNEGQRMGKGQTLVRLKADKFAAQVNQAAASVQSATQDVVIQDAEIQRLQAMVNSAASRRKLAENEFKRFEKLFSEQFISGQELDQRRTNYDTAIADYEAAVRELSASRARKQSAKSGITQAQSNYRYTQALAGETVLRAPFNGRVGQKYVAVGDYVAPGQKIVTVVDDTFYKVKFSVPERYLPLLRMNQSVLVSLDGQFNKASTATPQKPAASASATVNVPSDSSMTASTAATSTDNNLNQNATTPGMNMGHVVFIDPVVDPQNRTVTIKALVKDTNGTLRHGQSVIAKLLLDAIPNAIVVPEEAIVAQGEKNLVYVLRPLVAKANTKPETTAPGMPKPQYQVVLQEVVIAFRDAGKAQIVSGLSPNDRVVTDGLQKIFDGAPVLISKTQAK